MWVRSACYSEIGVWLYLGFNGVKVAVHRVMSVGSGSGSGLEVGSGSGSGLDVGSGSGSGLESSVDAHKVSQGRASDWVDCLDIILNRVDLV